MSTTNQAHNAIGSRHATRSPSGPQIMGFAACMNSGHSFSDRRPSTSGLDVKSIPLLSASNVMGSELPRLRWVRGTRQLLLAQQQRAYNGPSRGRAGRFAGQVAGQVAVVGRPLLEFWACQ